MSHELLNNTRSLSRARHTCFQAEMSDDGGHSDDDSGSGEDDDHAELLVTPPVLGKDSKQDATAYATAYGLSNLVAVN